MEGEIWEGKIQGARKEEGRHTATQLDMDYEEKKRHQ